MTDQLTNDITDKHAAESFSISKADFKMWQINAANQAAIMEALAMILENPLFGQQYAADDLRLRVSIVKDVMQLNPSQSIVKV